MDSKEWLTAYDRTEAEVNALSDKLRSSGGPGARKYNVERQLADVKKKIGNLDSTLGDMEAAPHEYGVGEGELTRRRGLMVRLNKQIVAVEDSLSGASNRRALMAGKGSGGGAAETEITANMSHQELHQSTQQQLKQQDDSLDSIARGVNSLKDLGHAMSGELDLHKSLLDDLDKQMDKTDTAFRNNTKRIDVVQEEDGSAAAGCGILICMLLLLVLIIWLAASNSACHFLPKAHC